MRYEQQPENPRFADPEYAEKWLQGEWTYMSEREQEELLLLYGPRKLRKAIRERRKAGGLAQKENKQALHVGLPSRPRHPLLLVAGTNPFSAPTQITTRHCPDPRFPGLTMPPSNLAHACLRRSGRRAR